MKKKFLLSMVLLSFFLMIGTNLKAQDGETPTYVAKIGDTFYETLKSAVDAANASETGATIEIISDFNLDKTTMDPKNGKLTIAKNITIWGNDHTLTRGVSYTGTFFVVNSGATLTLDGGLVIDGNNNYSMDMDSYWYDVMNRVKVANDNRNKWFTPESGKPIASAYMFTTTGGTINLNNVTIQNNYSSGSGVISVGAASTINLEGAQLKHICAYAGQGVAVKASGANIKVNMEEGTLIDGLHVGINHGVFMIYSGTVFTMQGGEIRNTTSCNSNGGCVGVYRATFILNGGKICSNSGVYGGSNGRNSAVYIHNGAVFEMNGGSICHNIGGYGGLDCPYDNGSLTITGGEVMDNISASGNSYYDINSTNVMQINGGTFSQDVSQWLSPDCGLVYDEETGTYTIVKDDFFEYNGKKYGTFSAVMSAIKANNSKETAEVKLLASFKANESMKVDVDCVLDFDGQRILPQGTTLSSIFNIVDNATFTVKNGNIRNSKKIGVTVYSDDFEDGNIEGWRVFQGSGDTDERSWKNVGAYLLSESANYRLDSIYKDVAIYDTIFNADSTNYELEIDTIYQELVKIDTIVSNYNSDNYIVSTTKYPIKATSLIAFTTRPEYYKWYEENYAVVVSEDNVNWEVVWSERFVSNNFQSEQSRYIGLDKYAGKEMYIGFRHYNNGSEYDVKGLVIDNVKLYETNDSHIFTLGEKNGSYGNLIIENGEFICEAAATTVLSSTIAYVNKGTMTVYGGKFRGYAYAVSAVNEATGAYSYAERTVYDHILDCNDANYTNGLADIIIKGGQYYGFDPKNNKAEGEETNFLSSGYTSELAGNYWFVREDDSSTFIFNADVDSEWNNPANWTTPAGLENTLPTENNNVIINGAVIINDGVVARANKLIVYTGASITIEDGGQLYHSNNDVSAKIMKQIVGDPIQGENYVGGWYTISSPIVGGVNVNKVSNLINGTHDLYRYNEGAETWENVSFDENNFRTLMSGRGYLYANTEDTELQFSGKLCVKDVNYTLSAETKGFNLIGNPFAHNITSDHFSGAALSEGFYVLTKAGEWGAKLWGSGSSIAPCQGALVQTQQHDAVLTISKNTNAKRRSNNGAIAISVSNGKYSDNAYVSFSDGFGLNKINHQNPDAPMLYIPMDGERFAVAVMEKGIEEIPVAFKAMKMGEYTISATTESCKFSELYLVDRVTGKETNLNIDSYTFIASTSDSPERFYIRMSSDASSDNFAFVNNGELIINNIEGDGYIRIFDVMGRPIAECNAYESARISVTTFADGVYIIQKVDDNGINVQKVMVK